MAHNDDTEIRARIPSDVDTPDKVVYGLTARQLAILAVAAVAAYGLYSVLHRLLPAPVVVAVLVILAGLALAVALGRRDGLPMDAFALAAIRFTRAPRRLVPADGGPIPAEPPWAPAGADRGPLSVLRLPADAIGADGVVHSGHHAVALVACTTVNIGLRSTTEQAALIGGYARWLQSLSGPAQIVVSTQRVDLSGHAQRIAERADTVDDPALAEAMRDYADFLDDLAVRCDPLCRSVVVAVTATGAAAGREALRRADLTATALTAIGVQTAVLDAAGVTGVLAAAVDPYSAADAPWPRTPPETAVTGGRL